MRQMSSRIEVFCEAIHSGRAASCLTDLHGYTSTSRSEAADGPRRTASVYLQPVVSRMRWTSGPTTTARERLKPNSQDH